MYTDFQKSFQWNSGTTSIFWKFPWTKGNKQQEDPVLAYCSNLIFCFSLFILHAPCFIMSLVVLLQCQPFQTHSHLRALNLLFLLHNVPFLMRPPQHSRLSLKDIFSERPPRITPLKLIPQLLSPPLSIPLPRFHILISLHWLSLSEIIIIICLWICLLPQSTSSRVAGAWSILFIAVSLGSRTAWHCWLSVSSCWMNNKWQQMLWPLKPGREVLRFFFPTWLGELICLEVNNF